MQTLDPAAEIGKEHVDLALLQRFDKPVPRYTSYPTAPEWGPLTSAQYASQLDVLNSQPRPLSLYFHIPFCKTMCLFCGCSVILNRRPENEERYVDYLLKEIQLVAGHLREGHTVSQLHFGGGTPTKLTLEQLGRLMAGIRCAFSLEQDAEISMEIDPRTVCEDDGAKLQGVRDLGFNRVSFGVQDTDPRVQEAVKRRQSYAMTLRTYELARALGFEGINIDLIYGLPLQTIATFRDTVQKIAAMRPDRIALFSYAKIPWLKEHQKAICEADLPTTEEKFGIYIQAREQLLSAGYLGIGMDHFALREDPLAQGLLNGKLHRNFQGYTLGLAEDLLGFGVTSIGYCCEAYVQNLKDLNAYYSALDRGELPVHRGKILTEEDRLRRWVINRMMCQFEVDKALFEAKFGVVFEEHFSAELPAIKQAEADGLWTHTKDKLAATAAGRLFVRNLAAIFDAYLQKKNGVGMFSKGV